MTKKIVAVPQSSLDKIEVARRRLYELAEEQGWPVNDTMLVTRLMEITGPMWEVANRKYPEVK